LGVCLLLVLVLVLIHRRSTVLHPRCRRPIGSIVQEEINVLKVAGQKVRMVGHIYLEFQ
jgi:hypothetical protein